MSGSGFGIKGDFEVCFCFRGWGLQGLRFSRISGVGCFQWLGVLGVQGFQGVGCQGLVLCGCEEVVERKKEAPVSGLCSDSTGAGFGGKAPPSILNLLNCVELQTFRGFMGQDSGSGQRLCSNVLPSMKSKT